MFRIRVHLDLQIRNGNLDPDLGGFSCSLKSFRKGEEQKCSIFYQTLFANCTFFCILGHHKLGSGSGVRFRWKSLDPDQNPDPKQCHFSYRGLRGSTGTSKKKVIILDLPAVYRGAITIIKDNESNPPVCVRAPLSKNAWLRMVPYLLMSFFYTFQK